MRHIEYYDNVEERWYWLEWKTVTSGMLVRIYEEDWKEVYDGTGVREMRVISDAYTVSGTQGEDVWCIDIEDPDPTIYPEKRPY